MGNAPTAEVMYVCMYVCMYVYGLHTCGSWKRFFANSQPSRYRVSSSQPQVSPKCMSVPSRPQCTSPCHVHVSPKYVSVPCTCLYVCTQILFRYVSVQVRTLGPIHCVLVPSFTAMYVICARGRSHYNSLRQLPPTTPASPAQTH